MTEHGMLWSYGMVSFPLVNPRWKIQSSAFRFGVMKSVDCPKVATTYPPFWGQ